MIEGYRGISAAHPVRVAWLVPCLTAGGIGPVCRYAAEGVAQLAGWRCTVVSLHEPLGDCTDEQSGVRFAALGLAEDPPRGILEWLRANPHDLVITNDVSRIEPAFPYFPPETLHVVQVHDSMRRYRDVAVRNHQWIDGVCCVARHIEKPLRKSLAAAGFRGVLGTVHNGAAFPPAPARQPPTGPIRLLFMGRMDPFKGIYDLVPILQRLQRLGVPVRLTIAGGHDELLEARFKAKRLDHLVTWAGRVPHEECYRLAAEHDVFLMLSRKEPFGMVTIEAMSMGCVPIAYDTPSGSTEIIVRGQSGLLVPLGDFRALAAAIASLHGDLSKWLALSAGAAQRARTEFSQSALASRLAQFLTHVCSGSRQSRSERRVGLPETTGAKPGRTVLSYQRLPAKLREWIRTEAARYPRVAGWLLKR